MRTTLDLDSDVLAAARDLARRRRQSLGRVLSDLARKALTQSVSEVREPLSSFYGFSPFPPDGRIVDDQTVERLRDDEGV
ncbi:MAG: CopG family transcriptional regulator [Burkholderiaceae bacterium]|nr:CopG family transcriptional regulator [Burkholderiaceae bacterium]